MMTILILRYIHSQEQRTVASQTGFFTSVRPTAQLDLILYFHISWNVKKEEEKTDGVVITVHSSTLILVEFNLLDCFFFHCDSGAATNINDNRIDLQNYIHQPTIS